MILGFAFCGKRLRPALITTDRYTSKTKRISATALCFLVVASLIAGISIYIDSVSVDFWSQQTQVGPVAMIIGGRIENDTAEQVRCLDHVTGAARIDSSSAYMRKDFVPGWDPAWVTEFWYTQGRVHGLSSEYASELPDVFQLLAGSYPTNNSQIAIPVELSYSALISLGQVITYGPSLAGERVALQVVGIYKAITDIVLQYYYDGIGIVPVALLPEDKRSARVDVDVDRGPIAVADPGGSLSYLVGIEKSIAALGSSDSPGTSANYMVGDLLGAGVRAYISSLNTMRLEQLSRAQGGIILGALLVYVGVRYNLGERRFEVTKLTARGASRIRIHRLLITELVGISIVTAVAGMWIGTVWSVFAGSSSGFMTLSLTPVYIHPALLTFDTIRLIFVCEVGISLTAYAIVRHSFYRNSQQKEEQIGKMERLVSTLGRFRWDVAILGLSILFVVAFYIGGSAARNDPLIFMLITFVPISLFGGLASMILKGLRSISGQVSRALSGIGGSYTRIGIRSMGRGSAIAGASILVIGLTLSLSLNSMTVAATVPQSELNNARFLIGGDIAFHLTKGYEPLWQSFVEAVGNRAEVIAESVVSVGSLSLSEAGEGKATFVAVNPVGYESVGYDYTGVGLEESPVGTLLKALDSNPGGAIVTSDIASEYDLSPGSKVRLFSFSGNLSIEFAVLGVWSALSEPTISKSLSPAAGVVGSRKIWLNLAYLQTSVNVTASNESYCCVRTVSGCRGDELARDITSEWSSGRFWESEWLAATKLVDDVVSGPDYQMDRAIDNMMAILSLAGVCVVFAVSGLDEGRKTQREDAVLRSLGANHRHMIMIRAVTAAGFILIGSLILLVYGPFYSTLSLGISEHRYGLDTLQYPGSLVPIYPVLLFAAMFVLYILLALTAYLFGVAASGRASLSESLDASWTTSALDGGID